MKKKLAPTVIQNCTFTSQPESIEAVRLRAEAIKSAAEAIGKIADALKGDLRSAPLLMIKADSD